jgi:hypothetical protein
VEEVVIAVVLDILAVAELATSVVLVIQEVLVLVMRVAVVTRAVRDILAAKV